MTTPETRQAEPERLARAALSCAFEPGDLRIAALVEEHGAVTAHQLVTADGGIGGLRGDAAQRLAGNDPERELEHAGRLGVRFVIPGDQEWPEPLEDLRDAEPVGPVGGVPLGLWVRGPCRLDELPRSVAVVGSRSSTTYGEQVAADIAAGLVRAGWCVVSGAAFGIDVAAHRGVLASGGTTVAVLACGPDRAYPQAHADLLELLAAEHAVVSEVPPGWAPRQQRFLSRNRLIAALCRGTVVVEAADRSGALNTATWTSRLSRELMAVPGPVTSEPSSGVHQLIRSHAAMLVTSAEEVLELVGDIGEHLLEIPRGPDRPRDRLDQRQQLVMDAVPAVRPAGSDSISRAAGLGLPEVQATLSRLEELGLVRLSGGGWRLA
jgi:DNA processing protein